MKIEMEDNDSMKLSFQGSNSFDDSGYSFLLSTLKGIDIDLVYKKTKGFTKIPEITLKMRAQNEIQIIPTGCTLEEITAKNADSICTKKEDQKYLTEIWYPGWNGPEIYRVYHSS